MLIKINCNLLKLKIIVMKRFELRIKSYEHFQLLKLSYDFFSYAKKSYETIWWQNFLDILILIAELV
jgi:hypothetical protein